MNEFLSKNILSILRVIAISFLVSILFESLSDVKKIIVVFLINSIILVTKKDKDE